MTRDRSLATPLTDALGVEYPIVQAPIGSATTPALAAAVSEAGGLGHLAVTWRDREETRRVIEETDDRTDAPFAVNLALDEATTVVPTEDHLGTVLEAGAEVVSFSFGYAGPYVDRVHDAGGIVLQTVGSAAEARAAVDADVDIVVTQGVEAGGHVQSEGAALPRKSERSERGAREQGGVATTALVPRVADAVDVPVIAAGGIADGRGVAAALALGADGAWLGTRFLGAEEARIHDRYRERVREADETDTRYSTLFDKGWPGMAHRVLENETIERWEAAGRPGSGERPGEDDVVARTGSGESIERYDEALATPEVEGDIEEMALYAGQSVGLVDDERPAADVVDELVSETREVIASLVGPR